MPVKIANIANTALKKVALAECVNGAELATKIDLI
jgi:hypothetical protein